MRNNVCLFRVSWMLDYQGMVCLAVNQIWWTWEVEDAFDKVKKGQKSALKDYAKKLHCQIDDLVVTVTCCHDFISIYIVFVTGHNRAQGRTRAQRQYLMYLCHPSSNR